MSQDAPNDFTSAIPTSVTTDITCRKCGYNLRGLTTDTRCPECGAPVSVSVSGDLLRYSDPVWVMWLSRGAKIIVAGVAVSFLGSVIDVVLVLAMRHPTGWPGPFVSLAGNALFVIGSWFVTASDPSGVGDDQNGTARKLIRITLLFGLAHALINLELRLTPLARSIAQPLIMIGGLASVVGVVGLFAQIKYFQKLAGRIPDWPLSSRAIFLKKTFPASYLAMILMYLFATLLNRHGAPARAIIAVLVCLWLFIDLVFLVFAIIYLLMVVKFSKRFKEQSLLAERNWATHSAGSTAS